MSRSAQPRAEGGADHALPRVSGPGLIRRSREASSARARPVARLRARPRHCEGGFPRETHVRLSTRVCAQHSGFWGTNKAHFFSRCSFPSNPRVSPLSSLEMSRDRVARQTFTRWAPFSHDRSASIYCSGRDGGDPRVRARDVRGVGAPSARSSPCVPVARRADPEKGLAELGKVHWPREASLMLSRLLTPSHTFPQLPTPSHAFSHLHKPSHLLTPSHTFSRCTGLARRR